MNKDEQEIITKKTPKSELKWQQYFEYLVRNRYFIEDVTKVVEAGFADAQDQIRYGKKVEYDKDKHALFPWPVAISNLEKEKTMDIANMRADLSNKYRVYLTWRELIYVYKSKDRPEHIELYSGGTVKGWASDVFYHGVPAPIETMIEKAIETYAYPFSIDISALASKRDVIDYIEQTWLDVEEWVYGINDVTHKRIRARTKTSREILDYIWNNKSDSTTDITSNINEKFDKSYGAEEVSKLLSEEKKLREQDPYPDYRGTVIPFNI